ncbi:hypothetical protein K435DRAFT_874438 [Dendrothele bispora CBS 962.96]|uniref:DUF6534 domain-containing protein n=1 Tax=Dendrothele bispora (strain CBS 962.96) TaxID=1314807 RepID=A0A4S8KWN2_DENBC|nr:hypothetical protein K435DRAFT_874438 [Dendrothele bispora CBS 962.96]
MSLESPLPHADLSDSWGVALVAAFLAMGLWSVYCMQMFIYFFNYPKDPVGVKLVVVWLWVVSTAHIALAISAHFDSLVVHFGDLGQFTKVTPQIIWLLLPTTLIALTVQAFFVHRLWLFDSRRYRLPIAVIIGMAFQLGGNIYTLYQGQIANSVDDLWASDHVMLAYYAIAAVVDILIAGCMSYLLWKRRFSNGIQFSRSTRLVYRLTILSINSGLWTAIFAIGVLILSIVNEGGLQFSIFYFPLAHLYSNCLLANLTTRNYIKTSIDSNLSTLGGVNIINLTNRSGPQETPAPRVVISTETHKSSDYELPSTSDPDSKDGGRRPPSSLV